MSSKPSQESGSIPSDVGGMTGVARDEALYQQAYGESIYDRDASAFMTVSIVSFFCDIFNLFCHTSASLALNAHVTRFLLVVGRNPGEPYPYPL